MCFLSTHQTAGISEAQSLFFSPLKRAAHTGLRTPEVEKAWQMFVWGVPPSKGVFSQTSLYSRADMYGLRQHSRHKLREHQRPELHILTLRTSPFSRPRKRNGQKKAHGLIRRLPSLLRPFPSRCGREKKKRREARST